MNNIQRFAQVSMIAIFLLGFCACESQVDCPDGMTRCELQDGTEICVPSHLGC